MSHTTIIREATVEDAEAMAAIHVQAWQSAYADIMPVDLLSNLSLEKHVTFWKNELTTKRSVNRVAEENNTILGWASGATSRDEDTKGGPEIYAVYVSPENWSRGTGRRLMQRIEEDLSCGQDLTLWVLEENQRAIGFYLSIGYEPDGLSKNIHLGGKDLTEIRLRKRGKPTESGR